MQLGFESTADEAIAGLDLSGKVAVVTGANSGIGFETARVLAGAGATVIVTARDQAKTDDTVALLKRAVPSASISGVVMELGSLRSVRGAAAAIRERAPRLQLLINNAGVMFAPLERTEDGFESQFGINHLGHFVLTCRLIPSLLAGAPARVISVSSSAHMFSDVHWDDPNFERTPYDKFIAYSQSKTANILFAKELDARLAGRSVRAFSLHPGSIGTNLVRHMGQDDAAAVGRAYATNALGQPMTSRAKLKSVEQGAATSVWAATSPQLDGNGGEFLVDCQIAPAGDGSTIGYMPYAVDPERARRLWQMSEQLTGETFMI